MMVVICPPSIQEPHAGLYLPVELECHAGILERQKERGASCCAGRAAVVKHGDPIPVSGHLSRYS